MDATYWAHVGKSLLKNLRDPQFAKELALSGVRQDTAPALGPTAFLDAYPDAEGTPVDMGTVAFTRSNLDPMEQYVLAALIKLRQPRCIFEIGTYDGATTLILARNAADAAILTLDLPPESAQRGSVKTEVENAASGVGSRFQGQPEAERITQLLGDSRTFDFSPWYGRVDLVLVDAGHEYDCTQPDTANAYRLLSRDGLIVWDDYHVGWPGVVRAVDEQVRGQHLIRVAATDFAIYDARLQTAVERSE